MTREEAIQIINCYDIGFYDLSGEKIPADKLVDAFYMATEALSAVCDDCIWNVCNYNKVDWDALPSADRKGKWIHCDTDNSIECDKCGCALWANDIMNGEAYFCPNCGADMRGETE